MLRMLALVAGLFVAGFAIAPQAASAAPVTNGTHLAATSAVPVETVQYGYGRRGYGGPRRVYGGPRYGRRFYGGPRRFYGGPRGYVRPYGYGGPRRFYGY